MRRVKKVRWDPIIAKLANYGVKSNACVEAIETDEPSRVKANWTAAAQKRGSKKEFEAYLHDLFAKDGPVVKYQNPDAWNAYPSKKRSGNSN